MAEVDLDELEQHAQDALRMTGGAWMSMRPEKMLALIAAARKGLEAETASFAAMGWVSYADHTAALAAAEKIAAEDRARAETAERERDIAKGELAARAKTMLSLRNELVSIHDGIEDEGDRVYFGSTNDADALSKLFHELDAWNWHDIVRDSRNVDPFETARSNEAAEARVAKLEAAARSVRPYLIFTIGPESPGHHPTMPSAVSAFLEALEDKS